MQRPSAKHRRESAACLRRPACRVRELCLPPNTSATSQRNTTTPPPAPSASTAFPPASSRALPFYFRRKWVSFGEPIPLFEHLHSTFGHIAHYRFMGTPIVFINDPDYIHEILVTQAASFVNERTLKRMKILLGEGLITSDDPIHMRQRRIVAPAFHRQRIAGYAEPDRRQRRSESADRWSARPAHRHRTTR